MRKIILTVGLLLSGVYAIGYVNLSEGGVNRFFDEQEELLTSGNADALCDRLTEDMEFEIKDHTARLVPGGKVDRKGRQQEMCAEFKEFAQAMSTTKVPTQVERANLKISRSILEPWTANVSFSELRSTSIPGARLTIKTQSDDRYILKQTIGGVKIRHLQSEAFLVKN